MTNNLKIETHKSEVEDASHTRQRHLTPIIIIVLIITCVYAVFVYRGVNARLLGPPLGAMIGQDFRQILRASQAVGEGNNPYLRAIAFGREPNFREFMQWEAAPYPYPPTVAVLAMPLLRIDEEQALVFWTWINWFFIGGCAILGAVTFYTGPLRQRLAVTVLLFVMIAVYAPVQLELKLVQIDILILFLLLATYWLYLNYWSVAGAPLGLAIALKPIVAPLLLYFAWKRQWRIFLVGVATAGLLTAFGFSVAGWHLLPDYLEVNRLWTVSDMLAYPFNQSVGGVAMRLFSNNGYIEPIVQMPQLILILRIIFAVAAVGAWLFLVSREERRAKNVDKVAYGLTLTTTLFLSPLVDDIHFVWILMPLFALFLILLGDVGHDLRMTSLFLLTLLCYLYLAHPDLHDAIYYGSATLMEQGILVSRRYGMLTGAYFYGLVLLEICLVVYLLFILVYPPRDHIEK